MKAIVRNVSSAGRRNGVAGVLGLLTLAASTLSGCTPLSESWELDHARVIAVRLDPPSLGPGQQGKLTALVVNEDGTPLEITPAIAIVPTEDAVTNRAIKIETGTWAVVAGNAEAIAAARAAAQLPDMVPLRLKVGARFVWADVQRDTLKDVYLGDAAASNPDAPQITLEGAAIKDAGPAILVRGKSYQFGLSNFAADPTLAFQWAVSTGQLTKSETPGPLLEIDDTAIAGPANLIVVVRNDRGGVAWATATIRIE
ncbi:MAG: hypothetical protein KBG15_10505 [Kofleriaceae bacterium]|nr:hypothetical protein [Kofleriaceae bacterium]